MGEERAIEPRGRKAWNSGRHYYTIKIKVVEKECNETGYLLGWLITDGHLNKKNGMYFGLADSDVLEVKEKIERILSIMPPLRVSPRPDGTTEFVIWSKALVVALNERFGIPIGKKKDIVKIPKQILASNDANFVGGFMRGVFEGDGSAGVYTSNRQVTLCGENPKFLIGLEKLQRKWGIYTGILRKMGGCYGFNIKTESFKAFFQLAYGNHQGLYLKRKFRALKKVVSKTPQKYLHDAEARAKISQSLKRYYNKHPSRVHHTLTRPFLVKSYVKESESATKIGKDIECSSTTIYRYMENMGIKRRSQRDAKLIGRVVHGN